MWCLIKIIFENKHFSIHQRILVYSGPFLIIKVVGLLNFFPGASEIPYYIKGILTTQRESLLHKRKPLLRKGILTTQKESLLHKANPYYTKL